MIRPVWHSPLRNETDSSDHLQSDVMRFMAILAFCLVAIFALVQSLPQPPVNVTPAVTVVQEQPEEPPPVRPEAKRMPSPAPEPAMKRETAPEPAPQPLPEPDPLPEPVSEPDPILVRSKPPEPVVAPTLIRRMVRTHPPRPSESEPKGESPLADIARQVPPPQQTAPRPVESQPSHAEAATQEPEPQEGFLLRFVSDKALLALVAQRRVEVFGWTDEQAWRLSSQRGLLEFRPANAPRQFHEMATGTVPASITAALNDAAEVGSSTPLNWGVTLPADMSRQLRGLLREHESGTLLIHANGRVRLEGKG